MMKPVIDFAKQAVALTSDMRQCKADIKELEQGQKEIRQELRDLTMVVQRLAYEVQRNYDNEQHEREKLILRLENVLLRSERSLPPAVLSEEDEKDAQIAALKQENEELKRRLEELEQGKTKRRKA
jgi:hypothetical protein